MKTIRLYRRGFHLAAAAVVLGGGTLLAGAARAQGALSVKGSDTMVNLSQAWAETFMKANPGTAVSITGGGTGTGIAAFLNGTTDLANASRPMSQREIDQARTRGVFPKAHAVALDGLAVAVYASNPVQSLTKQQLASIYSGAISDWSQVGGKPGRIVVLSRESSSGTYGFFREHVLGNRPYRPDAQLMPSTRAIQQELSNNPNAIGYGGEAYFKSKPNVKILSISPGKDKPAIYPSNENVASGKYPIERPLYVYSRGTPKGLAAQFIKFCQSPDGQRIVAQTGYVPMPSSHFAAK
jgi:phosphate transport system substrate-binding protein